MLVLALWCFHRLFSVFLCVLITGGSCCDRLEPELSDSFIDCVNTLPDKMCVFFNRNGASLKFPNSVL